MATTADLVLNPGVPLDEALGHIQNLTPEWRPVFDWFVYATSAQARLEFVTMNKEARQLEDRLASLRQRGYNADSPAVLERPGRRPRHRAAAGVRRDEGPQGPAGGERPPGRVIALVASSSR
jgi:hypothetical protein